MLGYAIGDFGYCLYWKVFEFYLLFFYADVFGIAPVVAGTMFLVTRVLDAAIDPLMGMWADRTHTRWGSFRPFVLVSALPLAVLGVLTFTTPDLSPTGKVVWAYLTYGITMLIYTIGNIPYGAMLGVLTADIHKRTTLSAYKLVGASAGGLVVTKATKDLVAGIGGGDDARGWTLVMVLYGLIAVVCLGITFFSTRERVRPSPTQKTPMKVDLQDLLKNKPWATILGAGFVIMLTIAIRNGTGVFYLKYYARRDDLTDTYLTLSSLAYVAGAAMTPLFSRRLEKKVFLTICMIGVALLSFAQFFVPRENVWLMIGITVAASLVIGPKSPLSWSMFADSADFSEWKTGRRATALIFSAATFGVKMGGAVAGWVVGVLLSSVGYVPNQEQSAHAAQGILWLATLIPGGFALFAALAIQFYPLDAKKTDIIQRDLQSRRAIS